MDRSDYGSKEVRREGTFKVVQVAINGESLLYFGDSFGSTHGIILQIALKESLGIEQKHPSREGINHKVLGMGKVDFHPEFKRVVFSGKSLGYGMDMREADITAIQTVYPDWKIILSY